MNCPKCGSEAYLSEEEAVKVIETTTPIKIVIKATYVCKACSERFSRIVYEDLEAKKKETEETVTPTEEEAVAGVKFLDKV